MLCPFILDHDDRDPRWVPAIVAKRFVTCCPTSVWFREAQTGDATYINCNDVTFRQMTQNLVILPGCPKAEKRTPPFQSSYRTTLRQRPQGNRRRHKTLARNMDRAIHGDQNGRENLVNFFVVKVTISLPHRGGNIVVFSQTFYVHV